jgi:hypothetical protein
MCTVDNRDPRRGVGVATPNGGPRLGRLGTTEFPSGSDRCPPSRGSSAHHHHLDVDDNVDQSATHSDLLQLGVGHAA